jgi:hypothetical protein
MAVKTNFWSIMLLLCCFCASIQGQTDPNNWQKLNLNSTTIAGVKVYYEKSFEPNLPFFEKKYRELLSQRSQNDVLNAKKDQILTDINTILGVTEPNTAMQNKIWDGFLGILPSIEKITSFYLVKQSTTKEFLRDGGQLPNFTYNKNSDTVGYQPYFKGLGEFAFPIASKETFEKDVLVFFQMLQTITGNSTSIGIDIHEITELTILSRAKPTDAYWRWFSDGFANAVTYEILKKHVDTESADKFIQGYDVNKYTELQKEINLQYWMIGNFCILLQDIPTVFSQRFNYARYCYATLEARRLVDKYGIDCIRKIMDEISEKQSRNGSDLLETIKNVTGEDMEVHLAAYQSFEQRQQGIEKYAMAFNTASNKKDSEQMAFNLFRIHELRSLINQQFLDDYRYAATLLFKLGYERDADMVMENCIVLFSNPNYANGRIASLEAFTVYALECKKPTKAQKAADELLKNFPYNVSALTIKMQILLGDNQLVKAKELAQIIISQLDNHESLNYKAATSVLAMDVNQPSTGK